MLSRDNYTEEMPSAVSFAPSERLDVEPLLDQQPEPQPEPIDAASDQTQHDQAPEAAHRAAQKTRPKETSRIADVFRPPQWSDPLP